MTESNPPLGAQLTGAVLCVAGTGLFITGKTRMAMLTLGMLVVLTLGYYAIRGG